MATSSIPSNTTSKQKRSSNRQTHGKRDSAEYNAYYAARSRCRNSQATYYGKRGIEFRFESFEEFYAEVGDRPSSDHSLDRIDTDGHYEKGNVRWANPIMQRRNQRRNRRISLNGESRYVIEWAEIYKITLNTILSRRDRGWCDECSVVIPVNGGMCVHMSLGGPRQTLTADQVKEIRGLLAAGGITHLELGRLYGVAKGTISKIYLRTTWKHI